VDVAAITIYIFRATMGRFVLYHRVNVLEFDSMAWIAGVRSGSMYDFIESIKSVVVFGLSFGETG
jgi:hypothetical protein